MLTWNSLVLCHKNCASPVWQEPVVLWSGLYYFSVSVEVFESSWFPHLWKSCLMNFCWSDERKMCRCYNELFCDCWSLGSFFTCMLTMRLPSLASHHRTFSVWFSVGLWGISLVSYRRPCKYPPVHWSLSCVTIHFFHVFFILKSNRRYTLSFMVWGELRVSLRSLLCREVIS